MRNWYRSWRRIGRRVNHYLVLGLIAAASMLVVSGFLFFLFERGRNSHVHDIWSGYAWVARTLLEEAPWDPVTAPGRALYYVVLVAGVGMVATGTGAIASTLVDLLVRKDSGMQAAKDTHHIVICGWNSRGEEIIRELHAEEVKDQRPIVILADRETNPFIDDLTTFVRGNPSNAADLNRAGIERAETAIVLADDSHPGQTAEDRDAKTLLTTLAIESINPACHTCVEVIKSENYQHFERAKADEVVITAELTGALLAASASNHGISKVVADLVTHPQGNEFYSVATTEGVTGLNFGDAVERLKRDYECLLIAVSRSEADYDINPNSDRVIQPGDRLLVIGRTNPSEKMMQDEPANP